MGDDTFLAVLGRARSLGLSVEQVILRAVQDYVPGNPGWGIEQIANILQMQPPPMTSGEPREHFLLALMARTQQILAAEARLSFQVERITAENQQLRRDLEEARNRVPVSMAGVLGPAPGGGAGGSLTLQGGRGGAGGVGLDTLFRQVYDEHKPAQPRVDGPTAWERLLKDE
jgi:hypothetical protein